MLNKQEDLMKYEIIILFALLTFSVFAISPVQSFNITTDEITTTSIIWNLSQKSGGDTITEIVLDGIIIEGYSSNATRIVQSNLNPSETHIITVMDSSLTLSEKEVTTLPKATTQSDSLFTTINLYILILLSLIFVVAAIYTGIGFLGFIGTLITLVGLIGSIGNNFITGLIFVIMFIVTLVVGFTN